MMPSLRSWSPIRLIVGAFSLVVLVAGGWFAARQLLVHANPAVNGTCDGVDRCLEPTQASSFIGRAIESDPLQTVARHEWDFTGGGSFADGTDCVGSACTQACTDGRHNDCSVTQFSYSDPDFFESANERKVTVGMRGVDSDGAAGSPQQRLVGVAIAYVGPDRGSSGLAVGGINAGGFTVTWRDVTDVVPSAYSLHIDNLDDPSASQVIAVDNDKPSGGLYTYPASASASTHYLVWVSLYYDTDKGPIARQSFPSATPPDPIVGVPVTTPANAPPVVTILRTPGNTPPAATPPSYLLLRQVGSSITLDIGAVDPEGDGIASIAVNGIAALSGATFSPGVTTSTLQWAIANLAAVPAGDYPITVVARDTLGATTNRPLVIRVNSNPGAPTALFVNTNDASAGLPSGDPSPVAMVIDDNLADQNLKLTFLHADPESDAAASYHIQVDTDAAFASPQTWDSGTQNLAVNSGSRSANITYTGPSLTYGTDYWWRVQVGDSNGLLSSWSSGRFKMRPTNYTPTIAPVANQAVDVGATLSLALVGFDQDIADGLPQTLTYYAQGGLPSPRMNLNANTGAFSFTPTGADLPPASPYNLTFCVRDSYTPPAISSPCATVQITVNLNLAAPTGLTVNFSSPIAGTANWTHSAPGEDGFQLDVTSPVAVPDIAEVGPNITTAGLAFSRCDSTSTVNFQVRAFVDAAARQFSGAATASANRPGWAAPTSLAAAYAGTGNATLTWAHPAVAGRTGYKVYRNGALLATLAANITTYADSGLVAGNTYSYTVRPYVNIPTCAPADVMGATATLSWTQPSIGVTFTPATGLVFPDTVVGTSSPTMTIQVRNTGGVPLNLTASVAGADASQFAILPPAPGPLPAGGTWTASIQFRPTAVGAKAATFQVTDPAYSYTATATLSGNGTPAAPPSMTATWTAISGLDINWTYSPPDPAGFQVNVTGYGSNPLLDAINGSERYRPATFAGCYMATGTTHTVRLRAYTGSPRVYSAEATVNAGDRPGWELPASTSFAWIDPTTARLTWTDPATSASNYRIRVLNGASVVLTATTTADDQTSMDLTGLAGGTNYTVTMQPFRTGASLNGCPPLTLVYGATYSTAYRQPNIDLAVYVMGNPANELELTELDAGGVWIGDDLTFPVRIHNNGDPLTITGSSYSASGGGVFTSSLFSTGWPGPFNTGADWNTNVQFQVTATTSPEVVVNVRLAAGSYGQVLDFPIRMVPLVDGTGVSREIFVTNTYTVGDFGTAADAQINADAFCEADSRGNPAKRYKSLLWFDNNPPAGTLAAGTLYRSQANEVVFGTRQGSAAPPYTAQHAVLNPGISVWTGRGMSGPAYNCNNWTGGLGASGATNDTAHWSLAYGGASNCTSVTKPIYCVEVPNVPGDQIVVSGGQHNGDFKTDANYGGATWYERANDFCQVDPRTDNAFEWRALMWGGASLPQTVTRAGRTYYNINDEALFTPATDNSVSESLSAPVSRSISLANTGYQSADQCASSGPWSYGASGGGINARGGFGQQTDRTWLDTGSSGGCSLAQSIYCVQQPTPAKRIKVVGAIFPSFGSDASIPGATWWEKANSECGSGWKALIWGDGALPQTVTHAGTLYVSNESGHRLFTAASDNDVPTTVNWPTYVGVNRPMATGYNDAANDCGGAGGPWTSSAPSQRRGQSANTNINWLSNATTGCGAQSYLYCVEQ